MTKRMLLIGAKALSCQYGLKYCSFIPSTLYGNDYHDDSRQMHFIFDLVRKISIAANGGPAPILWGDGHQIREIIHVDDFVRAMLFLMPTIENEIINVGAGKGHSIREFATIICKLCNYDPSHIIYDANRYVGARAKTLAVDKLMALNADFRQVALEDGLAEVIEWYSSLGGPKL
jgi:nucleoside-diphosphate-sugar epimerase